MGIALGVTALVGGLLSAKGQMDAGKAESQADNYNADVADQNAKIADQKATWAAQEGVQNSAISQTKTAAEVGGLKANQAASGLDVNTGSTVDVRDSARQIGMLDAMTIRSNAAREVYGYKTQKLSEEEQAQMSRQSGKNAKKAAKIGAVTTLLGTAGGLADNYGNYKSSKSVFSADSGGNAFLADNPKF